MKRFDRRKRLLSQKRKGSFDPNQYYLERDKNSRALRKIRVLLRKMEPVALVGPAWDARTNAVLELSSALATGQPSVWMHIANCKEIWNWDTENAERWLIARVADSLGLTSVSKGVSQLRGDSLHDCLWELTERATGTVRTALCLHGFHAVEQTSAKAFSDWIADYVRLTGCHDRIITFLATGPEGSLGLASTEIVLPEWDGIECVEENDFSGPARIHIGKAMVG
jgi:hypothetical protein